MSQQGSPNKIELCHYQIPKKNQVVCGDSYITVETDHYFICAMADGLGSGEHANAASQSVIDVVEEYHQEDVHTLMGKCNQSLKMKRGAAVAIFKVYFENREFVYSCVGNISFFLYSPSGKMTYPLPVMGYLSGRPQAYHTQRFPYQKNSTFLIYTDGLKLRSIKALLSNTVKLKDIERKLIEYEDNRDDDFTFVTGMILK